MYYLSSVCISGRLWKDDLQVLHSQCFHTQVSGTPVPPKQSPEQFPARSHVSWAEHGGHIHCTVLFCYGGWSPALFCYPIFTVSITAIPHQLPGIQVSIWEAKDATGVYSKTEKVHFSPLGYNVFNRSQSRSFCVPRCSSIVFCLAFLLFLFFLTACSFPRT